MTPGASRKLARWGIRRAAYYASLGGLFVAIAFYFGPNYILFRKLRWITPDDFAAEAMRDVRPIVLAIKAYEADFGVLPSDRMLDDHLVPKYLPPSRWSGGHYPARLLDRKLRYWTTAFNQSIVYDFNPGTEGWFVSGPMTSGPIALPIVCRTPSAPPPATAPPH